MLLCTQRCPRRSCSGSGLGRVSIPVLESDGRVPHVLDTERQRGTKTIARVPVRSGRLLVVRRHLRKMAFLLPRVHRALEKRVKELAESEEASAAVSRGLFSAYMRSVHGSGGGAGDAGGGGVSLQRWLEDRQAAMKKVRPFFVHARLHTTGGANVEGAGENGWCGWCVVHSEGGGGV